MAELFVGDKDLNETLADWENCDRRGENVSEALQKIATVVEKEIETWYKTDPDPFDDRHPGRSDPECGLGNMLKIIFKNENLMNKLVNTYLTANRDNNELHVAASRLLLDLMPGLEASTTFQENESLVDRLMTWAVNAAEPLKTYSIGLLAHAMELQDIAAKFREQNARLVPAIISQLHELIDQSEANDDSAVSKKRHFALAVTNTDTSSLIHDKDYNVNNSTTADRSLSQSPLEDGADVNSHSTPAAGDRSDASMLDASAGDGVLVNGHDLAWSVSRKIARVRRTSKLSNRIHNLDARIPTPAASSANLSAFSEVADEDCSAASWQEIESYVVGTYHMWPLTSLMRQRILLQYLTPMGEYQELLTHVFEQRAMDLIFYYLDLQSNTDVRLAFASTKYLAALLCHKKFAIDFIHAGGVECLLKVHRPSVAATGVSMCLYYLAYFEDTMERVCQLPQSVLERLINYVLWLLECSHESGRCHATMFFGMAFPFRVIIDLFDKKDGLRRLINVISTLRVLSSDETDDQLSEDEIFTSRQAARHVTVALKKYFETHLALRAAEIRRQSERRVDMQVDTSPHKAVKVTAETMEELMELLLEYQPPRSQWAPAANLLRLGAVTKLLQLLSLAANWDMYTGKMETMRCGLDVLAMVSVLPSVQLLLCNAVPLPDNISTPAVSILLGLAEGEAVTDAEVQKAALRCIANSVCGPFTKFGSGVGGSQVIRKRRRNGTPGAVSGASANTGAADDLLVKMWDNMRANNGIMVLLKLLMVKTPITEADAIRALACKALVGLVRCETVKQIVSKLPLFSSGHLQQLMEEPLLQDKRREHNRFCQFANELIEKIVGKPQASNVDASLDRIRRADVVAQTKIIYMGKELLQLIHEHLLERGLKDTAAVLQKEANLPCILTTLTPVVHPASPHIFSSPRPVAGGGLVVSTPSISYPQPTPSAMSAPPPAPGTPLGSLRVELRTPTNSHSLLSPIANRIGRSSVPVKVVPTQLRLGHGSRRQQSVVTNNRTTTDVNGGVAGTGAASLDKIVTEYLRKQHATCRNPVQTCPPFSLFTPHRCPEPLKYGSAPTNITARLFQRSTLPRFGGPDGMKWDRKFIYSRFRPMRSYRDTEEDGCFRAACEKYLILGTYAGEIKYYDLMSGEETSSTVCHNAPINHCEVTRDGRLLLTCTSWGTPLSALWTVGEMNDLKHAFDEDQYVEFSKHTQNRIIGTKEETATVYDVETGMSIVKLYDQDKANNYTRNRATFNSTDELILNDGVLWDHYSGKPIHKFDKFNPHISGLFHPNGLEVIINTEVWDLRMFHLLHTVPALDQSDIKFNNSGTIIYGAIHQSEEDDIMNKSETKKSPFGSSFRTFDATDYSSIATFDVKRNIFDLCPDSSDCYLAVVENLQCEETLSEESCCRIYEVGCLRDEDDQQDDEEEEVTEDDDDEDDDDDILDIDDSASDGDNPAANGENGDEEQAGDEAGGGDEDEAEIIGSSDSDVEDSDNASVIISSVTDDSDDITEDSEDDDDIDNMYFELSDVSNM